MSGWIAHKKGRISAMTKNRSQILCWVLVGFVAAAVGTGSATAESCGTAADRADVVRAVQTMFVAAAKDNITLFHTVTSPDFYAFDNGKQFHGDELMGLMQQLHAKGHVYVWKVTEPRVTWTATWLGLQRSMLVRSMANRRAGWSPAF